MGDDHREKESGVGPLLNQAQQGEDMAMVHKKVLEWQAAHPNITWIGWGIAWAIVIVILFWPRKSG